MKDARITREKAVEILLQMMTGYATFSQRIAIGKAIEALKQPEQKKGKWIKVEKVFHTRFHSDQPDTYHEYRCTVCLKVSDKATNYCPECGAKMEIEG